ncbi:MAG: TrkH family potassium uptake protein [Ignavibacteriales bacterium]|nr:MAG: TrkH family potassium uptake protein [Ignavibacteriales bacterium]
MNFKVIVNITGFLLILTGGFMLTGIPFSLYYHSNDIISIIISAGITIGAGFCAWYLTKNASKEISKREGYIIVTVGWIAMAAFGTLPFIIHGSIPSFTDAFFETMSGFTTTGSTILKDIEIVPHGLLFWRSMTHWIGGMGIILLSIAIIPFLGVGGMQLYKAEVSGPTKDKLHPRVQDTARRLWFIYVMFTFVEVVLLLIGGMNLFDAVCHAFGTLASGGFSTKNASIAYYNSPFIEYVIIIFMFIAGTNFTLHYYALHGKIGAYWKDSEFKFYFVFTACVVLSIAAYLTLNNNQTAESSLRDSAFSIISILSSTGFATVDYEKWASFSSIIFLILLMFGACAGSTSGGVKMLRYQLLIKNSLLELKRLIHPSAVLPVRHNGKAVPQDIISKVTAFVLIYLAIFAIGSVMLALTGLKLDAAMGSTAACMANIGPGLGSTGPVSNFGHLTDFAKWILSFLMLLGRLEIYTVLVVLSPGFWKS